MHIARAFVLCWVGAGSLAAAQENPAPAGDPPAAVIESAAVAQSVRIPAGTGIQIEVTEELSSKTSMQTQRFGLRLAEPIVIDGREVAPAGAPGTGEIIDAAPAAFGGRPGRLIVSARTLELNGQTVRIRGLQMSAAGQNRDGAAVGVAILAGPAGFLIQGGEVTIPAGARGAARLAVDVDIPITPPPMEAATPQ